MKIDIGRINHIMRLLNEYEQELIIMLLASERDMQKTLLSVLSQKMFLNRTFAKVFEICEHLMNSNKEVNVFTVTENKVWYIFAKDLYGNVSSAYEIESEWICLKK